MKSGPFGHSSRVDADQLADFILFFQRSCMLNLGGTLNRGKLSFSQFFLLAYLTMGDFVTMTHIAKKMGHSTAAATGLVDRLESLGYVKRLHAVEDRRRILVKITERGSELMAKIKRDIASELSNALAFADEKDVDASRRANSFLKRERH